MLVDKNTPWDAFAPSEQYVDDAGKKRIKDAAVKEMFGDNGFFAMSIKTLLEAMHGETDALHRNNGESVFDVYRVAAFADWLEEFIQLVDNLTLKPTAQQAKLSFGCLSMTFDESVYIFLRDYFNLPSFDAVLTLTVGDYVLAKKDTYNKQIVERNQLTNK